MVIQSVSRIFTFFMLLIVCVPVSADTVFIVHRDNDAAVSQQDIYHIFLDKSNSFSNGSKAIPLNLKEQDPARIEMEVAVLKMNEKKLNQYWASIEFSGRGERPEELDTGAEIVDAVGSNPNMIGYVDLIHLNDSVRIIHKISVLTGR